MKTEDLMDLLASDAVPVTRAHPPLRMLAACGMGLAVAVPITLTLMGLNPALASAAHVAMFWVKLGVVVTVLGAALAVCARLAQPGRRLGYLPLALVLPPAALIALALIVLATAAPADRLPLVAGNTWTVCARNIALLALPTLGLILVMFRTLAPTRLRAAGAAAGLAAGASGALAYSLHCPELAAPFLALWYLLGMAIPALIGALLGPHMLRW